MGGLFSGVVSIVVAAPGAAYASTVIDVPCSGPGGGAPGLIAAIDKANSSGGGTIGLAAGCTYTVATDGTSPGAGGLPVVTTPITVNANGSTTMTWPVM